MSVDYLRRDLHVHSTPVTLKTISNSQWHRKSEPPPPPPPPRESVVLFVVGEGGRVYGWASQHYFIIRSLVKREPGGARQAYGNMGSEFLS